MKIDASSHDRFEIDVTERELAVMMSCLAQMYGADYHAYARFLADEDGSESFHRWMSGALRELIDREDVAL